ncbi:MAG: hypothetical protein AABY89_04040, partial [Acidobacteriota bacterium]
MRHPDTRRWPWLVAAIITAIAAITLPVGADQAAPAAARSPIHATPVTRLLIKNAMVVYGNAKPAFGPVDILVQDGLIARVGRVPSSEPPPDAVIDATGKYVL